MFSYEFKKNNSSTLTSGVSAAPAASDPSDYAETDPIDLTSKRHDSKNLSIYIDVPTTSGDSATSAYLGFYIAGGHNSGTTFSVISAASGTSLFLNNTSGTSQGAAVKYRYFKPLSIVLASGVTGWLKSIPYITLGCRCTNHKGSGVSTVDYNAWLMVG